MGVVSREVYLRESGSVLEEIQMKNGMGVRMRGDEGEAPVAEQKQDVSELEAFGYIVVVIAFFALLIFTPSYTRWEIANKGNACLSSTMRDSVLGQQQETIEGLATSLDDGLVVPDAWWDDYRIISGHTALNHYRYVHCSPRAYADLRARSEDGLTLSGMAQMILHDRRRAQTTEAPPHVK